MMRNKNVADHIKILQAYLGSLQDEDNKDTQVVNQTLAIQREKGNSSNSEWIINSGVTHCMIGNPKLIQNYKLFGQ